MEAYQDNNGPLTVPQIQVVVDSIVAYKAIVAAVGTPNSITIDTLNKATGSSYALVENENVYRQAIEDGSGWLFGEITEVQDIIDMIRVENAVLLLTDNSLTTSNASAPSPVVNTPTDSEGVVYIFSGFTYSGGANATISNDNKSVNISRSVTPGSVDLSLSVEADSGFYWHGVDYRINVPETGPIAMSINN
ncbi:hypothetical protein [Peribacillus asahii]|uniref:hypothetical protein n=1 Tax=Peribacillus asahii TaxID=228899 RepID=UPI0038027F6D